MSYDTLERSVRSGSPVECFLFACQDQAWRYTSHDQEVYHEWRIVWYDEACSGTVGDPYPYVVTEFGEPYLYTDAGVIGTSVTEDTYSGSDQYGLSRLRAIGGAKGVRVDMRLQFSAYNDIDKGIAFGFDPAAMDAAPLTTPYYALAFHFAEGGVYTIRLYRCTGTSATLAAESANVASLLSSTWIEGVLVVTADLSFQVRCQTFRVCLSDGTDLLADTTDTGITLTDATTGVGLWHHADTYLHGIHHTDYLRVYARDYDGTEGDDAPAPNHYTPEAIFRGEVEQNQEDQTGSIAITLPATNPVALLFRDFLPAAPVQAVVFRNHTGDLGAGIVHFSGTVSAVEFKGSEAVLTCLPLSEAFRRPIPWQMFQSQCGHPLYSAACGVDKTAYDVPATVTALNSTGSEVTAPEFAAYADRYFCSGWMEAGGEVRWIVGHTGDTITLSAPFGSLAVGASVTAYPGCDRTETVCENKFSNLDNFSGWSHIPEKNPFNSSLT